MFNLIKDKYPFAINFVKSMFVTRIFSKFAQNFKL